MGHVRSCKGEDCSTMVVRRGAVCGHPHFPCLVCLESCFTAVVCSSPATYTGRLVACYCHLGCHRVPCAFCIPCLPRDGEKKVTHTHTHADRMQEPRDGDRREPQTVAVTTVPLPILARLVPVPHLYRKFRNKTSWVPHGQARAGLCARSLTRPKCRRRAKMRRRAEARYGSWRVENTGTIWE